MLGSSAFVCMCAFALARQVLLLPLPLLLPLAVVSGLVVYGNEDMGVEVGVGVGVGVGGAGVYCAVDTTW